eukprot:318118_1
MARMINTFIVLVFLGMASAAETSLRNTTSSISNERSSDISEYRSGTISFEKSMECRGKFECDEDKSGQVGIECDGGLKADFEIDTSAKHIAHGVTQVLTEQMKDVILPNHSNSIEDLLYPSKKNLEALMDMDNFRRHKRRHKGTKGRRTVELEVPLK